MDRLTSNLNGLLPKQNFILRNFRTLKRLVLAQKTIENDKDSYSCSKEPST